MDFGVISYFQMGRTPLTPKGIGDLTPRSTSPDRETVGRTPLTPKGIGDQHLNVVPRLCAEGRTPLTPKGIGDPNITFGSELPNPVRGERPSRRKALETGNHAGCFRNILFRGERPSRRKALETSICFFQRYCRAGNTGRTPLTPKGIGDFADFATLFLPSHMGRTPLTPKGIGDNIWSYVSKHRGFGANAPHAERHWRLEKLAPRANRIDRIGANAPHAERHWRPISVFSLSLFCFRGANAPHAERHWRLPRMVSSLLPFVYLGRTPLTPKGIGDTLTFSRLSHTRNFQGRTPLTPKGIGDEPLFPGPFGLQRRGRTPLTPKGIGDNRSTGVLCRHGSQGANAPHAERHWRHQVVYVTFHPMPLQGRTPLTPKGIGDRERVSGPSNSINPGANAPHAERHWRQSVFPLPFPPRASRGERPSRRKALETAWRLPGCL